MSGASERIPDPTFTPHLVAVDTPCRKCAYNLRGLQSTGRCPECGEAVGRSIYGNFMKYCDPRWVRALARGVRWIVGGLAVMMVPGMICLDLSAIWRFPVLFMTIFFFIGYVMWLIGFWLLTSPDPSGLGEDVYGRSRRVSRSVLFVAGAVHFSYFALISMPGSRSPGMVLLLGLEGVVLLVVDAAGVAVQLHYFQKLADRIPATKLSTRAVYLRQWTTVLLGLIILVGVIIPVAIRNDAVFVSDMVFLVLIAAILMALFSHLLFIEEMGKRLMQEARLAETTWASIANQAAHAVSPP